MAIIDYENQAWDDFIENRITPFGKSLSISVSAIA
jgi:hypothetical protein